MDDKNLIDENRYSFWQNEFRTINFFSIKSGMGETKRIKSPTDLYKLPTEQKEKQFTEKQIEFFNRKLTDSEIRLIKSL